MSTHIDNASYFVCGIRLLGPVFELGPELLRILLRRVQPHFLAVRLNGGLLQETADLGDGNVRHESHRKAADAIDSAFAVPKPNAPPM